MNGLMHSTDLTLNGFMHSTDYALRGVGMGVEQAMANPLVKVGIFGLALYGAAVATGFTSPPKKKRKARRRRNP